MIPVLIPITFITIVVSNSCLVIAFAGDAIICVFCAESSSCPSSSSTTADDQSVYCVKAFQCAAVLKEFATAQLSTHIGISCGAMNLGILGGRGNQYIYLLNGACITELDSCIRDAGAKSIVATKMSYDLACKREPGMRGSECVSGSGIAMCMRYVLAQQSE